MITEKMICLYTDVKGIYGYRRMTMNINRMLGKRYNHKRIYRLMKSVNMKSVIRKKKKITYKVP
jgi:putative transposase